MEMIKYPNKNVGKKWTLIVHYNNQANSNKYINSHNFLERQSKTIPIFQICYLRR